jgi:hypothetical protein
MNLGWKVYLPHFKLLIQELLITHVQKCFNFPFSFLYQDINLNCFDGSPTILANFVEVLFLISQEIDREIILITHLKLQRFKMHSRR